jgi:CDP-6-deoxy-D-xylo-4-hexulose-3-dehydrase
MSSKRTAKTRATAPAAKPARHLKRVPPPAPVRFELAHNTWGEEEFAAVNRVLRSGCFTMGENVARFEKQFAAKFGSRYAVMVNSGSSANLIGVASLFYRQNGPLRPGDEVIVPAISWATTYHPLQQYGLRCRFVDVELDTLNIDTTQLERALTPRTRMVVAVSILGNPCALDTLREFCRRHELILFEDNCESMGATLGDRYCGTFGNLGTFSLFFSHHISTIEGGMIVTDDEELYELARCLRAHGWTRDLPPGSKLFQRRDDDFREAYRFILPGYNVRPMEFSGAVGSVQLKKLDAMIEARRRNAEVFQDLFQGDRRFILQRENGKSSWFSFTLILRPEIRLQRSQLIQPFHDAGIGFRMITGGCFLRHDVIRYYDHDVVGKTINADLAHDRGFFVGNSPLDLRRELELLKRVLDKV